MAADSFASRVRTLADRARRDREAFSPPAAPPDDERAMAYLRDGVGEAVWLYVDARTGDQRRIPRADFERIETAMNTWLELYARCYGVDLVADFTVRTAAELLVETHNIRDVAELLTHVPSNRPTRTTDR